MLLGVAGRRPKYWWDLGQSIDSDLGGLLGTHVRNSNGLYTNPTTELITTVGNNIPRFERQGGHLAILDEPAGTNLIQYSHELGNVASGGWWTDVRCTVTSNVTTAPDGNVTADKIVLDGTGASTHIVYSTIAQATFTDNASVTFSVYLKLGELTWVQLELSTKAAATVAAYFNLSTGAVGGEGVDNYGSEEAANGFWRFWITHDIGIGANNPAFGIYLAEGDGDRVIDGDSTSGIYAWGAQVEEFPVPTSYVPTSGATASRATESGYPLYDLPLGLFDAEGTASVWVRFGYPYTSHSVGGHGSGLIATSNNINSLLTAYYDGTNAMVYSDDAVNEAQKTLLNWPANTWYKFVVKWSSATSKMRVGYDIGAGIVWGAEVAFDGSYTLGTSLRLAFGLFGPMWLRDLRLYDRIPSDSEINSMGSP